MRFHCTSADDDDGNLDKDMFNAIPVHQTNMRKNGLRDLEVSIPRVHPCDLLSAIARASGDTLWRLRLFVGQARRRATVDPFCPHRFHVLRRLELVFGRMVGADDTMMLSAVRHHVRETLGASQCDIVAC